MILTLLWMIPLTLKLYFQFYIFVNTLSVEGIYNVNTK
jgi:hypothetical protein